MNIDRIRTNFPALAEDTAFFDGAGGTQTPRQVAEAISRTLCAPGSNRGSLTPSARNSEDVVEEYRQAMADFLGASPRGIVYGRSATQIAMDFSRALSKLWKPDDNIVLTRLDHESNVAPWLVAARRAGVTVRWIDLDPVTTDLNYSSALSAIDERTRLVAVSGASNLLGTRPDVARIAKLAHQYGSFVYVDGVHLAAHAPISVELLGADFFVCSAYKFMGPHGATLAADPSLLEQIHPDKLTASTERVPERFELGTLPYELLSGTTAVVNFIAELDAGGAKSRREKILNSMASVEHHDLMLRSRLEEFLATLEGVRVHSRAERRTSTLLLTFDDHTPESAGQFLASKNIAAAHGTFYADSASRVLGLGTQGGLRISMAPYLNDGDIDRLLAALSELGS
ncbi:cysteine desulfurase family protein (TIGR01976 family) [Psychromicrobium silvestre]|uniref:Cysteine desulfurase family protein (TIGR01976 family) n=1 Tax=Psychromicrobium silvestre TaxID=1645614 RepID=A0A7Y9S8G5_9MICC|nr:cysteine desulfurase-like protein [Psychromicrobium silvestre]NYE95332.1 cysteine desulfurase family protein (TIGR01976 family) [Psychromicrobium silvestre]